MTRVRCNHSGASVSSVALQIATCIFWRQDSFRVGVDFDSPALDCLLTSSKFVTFSPVPGSPYLARRELHSRAVVVK